VFRCSRNFDIIAGFSVKMGADAIDVAFVPVKTSTEVNQTLHPVYSILAGATLRLASTTEANPAVHYKRSHVLVYSFISVGTVAIIVLVAFVVRIINDYYVLALP